MYLFSQIFFLGFYPDIQTKYYFVNFGIMKRQLARLLLMVYLMALIPGSELAKLPFMWMHYQEHKIADASMDFFDFIQHHYNCGNKVYADAEKDMKLPFKSDHQDVAVSHCIVPKPLLSESIAPLIVFENRGNTFIFQDHFISLYQGESWQPPKISVYSC